MFNIQAGVVASTVTRAILLFKLYCDIWANEQVLSLLSLDCFVSFGALLKNCHRTVLRGVLKEEKESVHLNM